MTASNRFKLRLIVTMAATVLACMLVALPTFRPIRRTGPRNACINNLRQIDEAKEQWILQSHQTNGAPANREAINRHLKNGERKCPEGGTYTYGNVGVDPRCTIKGHELPTQ